MRALAVLVLAFGFAGCTFGPGPVTPQPDGPGDSRTACGNLRKLGGCGVDLTTCEADLDRQVAAESEVGQHTAVGCLTAAQSCEEADACQ